MRVLGGGLATSAGADVAEVAAKVRKGERMESVTLENTHTGASHPVLRVPPEVYAAEERIPRVRRSSVISHLALAATRRAVEAAGWEKEMAGRTALFFAASDGGVAYTRRFFDEVLREGPAAASPLLFPETVYNAPTSHLASVLKLDGPALTFVGDSTAACAALEAAEVMLESGEADYCVVAAAEEIDWILCEGYGLWGLSALENQDEKPIFAECAAALVLARDGRGVKLSMSPCRTFHGVRELARVLDEESARMLGQNPVDAVMGSDSGSPLGRSEEKWVRRICPDGRYFQPRKVLGESLAASTVCTAVLGAYEAREGGGRCVVCPVSGYNRQVALMMLEAGEEA